MPYYSSILPLVFVNEAPRALIAKSKKQPITRAGGDTFKKSYILASCLSTNGRVGVLRLKASTLKPWHIICQLGSGLDSVDGVKAVFLKTTFQAQLKSTEKGA